MILFHFIHAGIPSKRVGSMRRDYRTGILSDEGDVSRLLVLGYHAESSPGLPDALKAETVGMIEEYENAMRRRASDE